VATNAGAFSIAVALPRGLDTLSATAATETGTSAASQPIRVLELPPPIAGVSSTDIGSAMIANLLETGATLRFIGGTSSVVLTDGILSVGPGTTEATVQRLYEGLLARGGDAGGLGYYHAMLKAGASKTSIADLMLESPEYKALHGTLTDQQFVASIYQNVLDRPASADPQSAHWTGLLAQGSSRGDVAVGITDSAEARTTQAPNTAMVFAPNPAGILAHELYETGLGREIDLPSLANFQAAFGSLTPAQFAWQIAVSPEFTTDHGAQNNLAFVNSL
jgi:hypothetical protein